MSKLIPPYVLAKCILASAIELNISEKELTEIITYAMIKYAPFEQRYGVITHRNEDDYTLAKTHTCAFCGGVGAIYHGYKKVNYPYNYTSAFECKICGHTQEI